MIVGLFLLYGFFLFFLIINRYSCIRGLDNDLIAVFGFLYFIGIVVKFLLQFLPGMAVARSNDYHYSEGDYRDKYKCKDEYITDIKIIYLCGGNIRHLFGSICAFKGHGIHYLFDKPELILRKLSVI